jgi:uncharacterized membrane protein
MTIYGVAYVSALIVFLILDAGWLTFAGAALYKPTLKDILLADVKLAPAIAFYLMYPVGLIVFAIAPTLKAGSALPAIGYAALFGAIAYGTYDLTNYATLRNWTMQITVLDIGWGAFVSAAACAASYFATRAFANWAGLNL